MPTLLTTAVLILTLACSQAWGKPPVKTQKGNTVVPPSAEQPSDETISVFLPDASEMEVNLASTLCSGLWTHSTYQSCFPPTPQPLHECRFCAKTCKSKEGLTKHENNCKSRPRSESVPAMLPFLDCADLDKELLLDKETVLDKDPPLTLAECSRLVSAYIEQPEWQDFLKTGRYATTQTTDVNTGWAELSLETVSPADEETPFPALATAALKTLMQLSPTIGRLHQQLQTGNDPLADRDNFKTFISKADPTRGELFAEGNHSLVIKWRRGPGYVLKIARSRQDQIRLNRERKLYLWLRAPDNFLLNLTTTPMRAAFNISGKPVLALRQVDGTARDRLRLMREHSLNERLDFALSVISHFCQMYSRFLEKDVLLADRHDDNIGFNEIPLQGRRSIGLDDAVIQMPVMLDLDPYWFGGQEFRELKLHLPTWVPVAVGLLEEVFTPRSSDKHDSQTSQSRVEVIDQLRQLASPVLFSSSSSSGQPETNSHERETSFPSPRDNGKDISMVKKVAREFALQSCINHWFQAIKPEYSELLAEARSHIEPLLIGLNQWDSTPRTVAQWNKKLQENIGEVLQWLNSWKNETEFSLLKDFTDEGIIKTFSAQESTPTQGQQILPLLSMIHGKLRCQKCSRTFTTNTEFRKHWQHHQQNKLQHCEICGGNFIALNTHKRVHAGIKPYKCEHCGKCFSQSSHLKDHMRAQSGDKPYKCELCGKCFARPYTMKNHLLTHSGDKPYMCLRCGRGFSDSGNLRRHLHIHSDDKPCQCEHCGKCFAHAYILKSHLRTHRDDNSLICEHCGKGFSDKRDLIKHLRIHSGDKPYGCEHCGKCFSQSGTLKRHLRTHSGEKPFKCEHCGKLFSDSSNKNKHQKGCRIGQPQRLSFARPPLP